MGNFKLEGAFIAPFNLTIVSKTEEGNQVGNLKIYSVSDKYINYLRKSYPNVYSNKEKHRTHTRKYIGIVLELEGYHYYVPMSSPKDSDYQVAGDGKVIQRIRIWYIMKLFLFVRIRRK